MSDQVEEREVILAVPRTWTKRAYNILLEHKAVARPWHLQGRWGSRTHALGDEQGRMGFPIISKASLVEVASQVKEVEELLEVEGVEILTNQTFVISKRAREPIYYNATIHPERKRPIRDKKWDEAIGSERFTYAEMFCGIGGFGVALEALGGKCVFVSEIEENCRKMYQANFRTPGHCIHGDIHQVEESDLPGPGTLDLLTGGFPCQPFSNLSNQPGFECHKGRGLLFQEIIRVLECCKPKGFLLENVPGLKDMPETFDHIVKAFVGAGYRVFTEICSARGLTATSRKRLFFVGIRNDLKAEDTTFNFPYVPDLQIQARHILDYDELPEEELQLLRLVDGTMDKLLGGKRWRPHNLAWPNRPCNTITSHYGNAVGRGESQLVPCSAPFHPRRFSMRECARLMGFPNSYQDIPQAEHQGDMAYRKQAYRLFGNAVCPPLIAALAGAVLRECQIQVVDDECFDWIDEGLATAVALTKAATRSEPVKLPMGCLVTDIN